MAVLHNDTARLLVGLNVRGYPVPKWLPGKNPLDPGYWDAVKNSGAMRSWLAGPKPMIRVDLEESMPDPPTTEALAAFSRDELTAALSDPDVPVAWHPTLEAELSRREETPPERESVTGIPVAQALPLIKAETDIDRLIDWADADKRKSIRDAIDKRIAEIEAEPEIEIEE